MFIFKMYASWCAVCSRICRTTYGSILSSTLDLFELNDLTIFISSLGSVGRQKKLAALILYIVWGRFLLTLMFYSGKMPNGGKIYVELTNNLIFGTIRNHIFCLCVLL